MSLVISLVQFNPKVGDLNGNANTISQHLSSKEVENSRVVVFPELALTGYPPEDLLLRSSFLEQVEVQLNELKTVSPEKVVIIGAPYCNNGELFNGAFILEAGEVKGVYAKQCLPNYGVFDEKRYFTPGENVEVYPCDGELLGLAICEDLWERGVTESLKEQGATCVLSLNASPYHQGKPQTRKEVLAQRHQETSLPIAYVNLVGGQDEVVFDGGSFFIDSDGVNACASFRSDVHTAKLNANRWELASEKNSDLPELEELYQALVLGVKDYVNKNGFKGIVLGLSGGIDSALVLALAADALGPERVRAVMMPSRYTSDMSLEDAQKIAANFDVQYDIVEIESTFKAFLSELAPIFDGAPVDTTEENLQARARGVIVMAISNKTGLMVLTTGNKSEYAVGYSTLYGDMVGGFAPIKDVSKTLVFELCRWRNRHSEMIPSRIIERPPSAELAPDQKDEDSLPPYDILDQILALYVEQRLSEAEIVDKGFNSQQVRDAIRRVNMNEYKRRQAAPGVKVTEYAFGRERRYPITNGFS